MSLELHFRISGVTYRDWEDPRFAAAERYLIMRSLGMKVRRPD
jgi:hypothetical protein